MNDGEKCWFGLLSHQLVHVPASAHEMLAPIIILHLSADQSGVLIPVLHPPYSWITSPNKAV